MYKDKDKQREANRERQRRYKERSKALAKGVTSEGVTITGETVAVAIKAMGGQPPVKLKRGKDIKCFADTQPQENK